MTDILSASQFTRAEIEKIFARADELQTNAPRGLADKKIVARFYEPSAHTRESFARAAQVMGGIITSLENSDRAPSLETLAQEIAPIRADAIILRHPQAGAAKIAADATDIPIINAGDGNNEHPTSALAQLYALRAEKKSVDHLRVALVGDLKNGRAAHSLALLLAQFEVYVSLVAPAAMSLPYDLSDGMRARGITVEETNDVSRVLAKADAVILSRVDKKFFADDKQFDKMSKFYSLETIVAQKKSAAWLSGSWNGGAEILAEAYRKTNESARAVWMAVLEKVIGK